jgi:hypothetical protein
MSMKKLILLFICIIASGTLTIHAQQKDAGLWTSVTVEHQVTRKISVSVSEQLRMYQNISDIDQFFTDLGAQYELSESFRVSLNYRLSSTNQQSYFMTRHRFYVDLSYRYKLKPLVIGLRQRVQRQVEALNSSENGKIPEWYSRTRLSVKLDLNKKYSPYISSEIYYVIDNLKEEDKVFDKIRYEAGFDYKFNRRHSLNPFYLIQSDILEKKTVDYIAGLGYTYSF